MDIRLKNNHKLGILLILLILVAASAATMAFYPYMEKKAQEEKNRWSYRQEEQRKDFGNLATQLMNFSYEIWHQQRQEEEGKFLTFTQTFLPELEGKIHQQDGSVTEDLDQDFYEGYEGDVWTDEAAYGTDYYLDMQSRMDRLGSEWQSFYQEYGAFIFYTVVGDEGEYIRSNVNKPEEFFHSPLAQGDIQFMVEFSSSGRMSVSEIEGSEEDSSRLLQATSQFEFYDPLEKRMSESYRYSGVQFQGPKNLSILFRCNPTAVNGWDATSEAVGNQPLNLQYYLSGEGMYRVVIAILAVLLVTAFCLPFAKSLEIGRSRLCKWSFEPLSVIGFLWLMVLAQGEVLSYFVASFMNGTMSHELMEAGFTGWAAAAMLTAINLMFWSAFYGLFFWGIINYRAIISLGPWRYFKERTWLGRICRSFKRWVLRGLYLFNETDWQSKSSKLIGRAVIVNFVILTLISCLWFWGIGALIIYSIVLFFIARRYWGKMEEKYQILLEGINEIAKGNLEVEIQEDLGVFNPLKEQLSKIQEGFKKAVLREVKSERTKSELITNVSHDLKTPLTAIITYVNLLKQENLSEEERKAYIQVLDQKSMRLKVLIEDLFEVSKAANGTISLHLEEVDIVSLLKQVRFELADKIEESGIEFRCSFPEEKVACLLDSQKTYRIFENLMINITKYGMPGTRAYIQVNKEGEQVWVSMRNIAAQELTVSPEELTERFVRGDQSRNTEGSGLGLAIARSFVEAQGGTMNIEIEDDLFRVVIYWETGKNPENEAGCVEKCRDCQ